MNPPPKCKSRKRTLELVKVVLVLTNETNAQGLREHTQSIQQTLNKLGVEPEFALNGPEANTVDATESNPDLFENCPCGSLGFLLSKMDRPANTIIVDANKAFTDIQWQWVLTELESSGIVCCVLNKKSVGNRCGRFLGMTADAFTRLLLGTWKNSTSPGIVGLTDSAAARLVGPLEKVERAKELVAYCRSEGETITQIGFPDTDTLSSQSESATDALVRLANVVRFWWNQIAFPKQVDSASPNQINSGKIVNGKNENKQNKWSLGQWTTATLIIGLASLVLLSNLGYPLIEPDETRNSQLAMNIVDTGQWMSLTLENENYWDKPPLQAWMTAISYKVLGPSEMATRLPCALASLASILAMLLLGSRLFGFRAACFGAIALLSCGGFDVIARFVTMDASLCCFSTVMFLSLLLAISNRPLNRGWLLVAGIACGLGLLVKGPVIGVLVIPPLLAFAWLEGNQAVLKLRFWLYTLGPAAAIAAPWYGAMSMVHPDFISYFFWKHHVLRFANAFNHEQPWWFYIPIVLIMTYPAVFLLPSLFRMIFKTGYRERRALGQNFGPLVLFTGWTIGFFSISEAKLPTYILPAIPMICLMFGRTLDLGLDQDQRLGTVRQQLRLVPKRISLSLLSVFVLLSLVALVTNLLEPTSSMLLLGAVVLSTVLAAFTFRNDKLNAKAFGPPVLISVIFVAVSCNLLLPELAGIRSAQAAAAALANDGAHNAAPVVYFGRPPRATFFSFPDKQIHHFDDKHRIQAANYLADHPNAILVASKKDIDTLSGEMNESVRFLPQDGSTRLFSCQPTPNRNQFESSSFRTARIYHITNEGPLVR